MWYHFNYNGKHYFTSNKYYRYVVWFEGDIEKYKRISFDEYHDMYFKAFPQQKHK